MIDDNSEKFVSTNIRVFYRIAKESHSEMVELVNSNRRPNPNNETGWIISYDPEQKSFKNAFITIVFSGIVLESLLHILIVNRKGIETFKEYDRDSKKRYYESKLKLLGCDDQSILDLCEHFRSVRREIVHEKAYLDQEKLRIAQDEATKALQLIDKIITYFKLDIS